MAITLSSSLSDLRDRSEPSGKTVKKACFSHWRSRSASTDRLLAVTFTHLKPEPPCLPHETLVCPLRATALAGAAAVRRLYFHHLFRLLCRPRFGTPGVEEQTLPITGDNIYSEIQKTSCGRCSSRRKWHTTRSCATGCWPARPRWRRSPNTCAKSLTKNRHFKLSGLGKDPHLLPRPRRPETSVRNDPRDRWFFRTRAPSPHEINVDLDAANRDNLTIFINYRVTDYQNASSA